MLTTYLSTNKEVNSRNGNHRFSPSLFLEGFDSILSDFNKPLNSRWFENENEYVLKIDLPGYSNKDIDVEVEKDVLFVKAENQERGITKTSFTIDVLYENADKVSTKLENGVLSVIIPRNERLKRKKIPLLT